MQLIIACLSIAQSVICVISLQFFADSFLIQLRKLPWHCLGWELEKNLLDFKSFKKSLEIWKFQLFIQNYTRIAIKKQIENSIVVSHWVIVYLFLTARSPSTLFIFGDVFFCSESNNGIFNPNISAASHNNFSSFANFKATHSNNFFMHFTERD